MSKTAHHRTRCGASTRVPLTAQQWLTIASVILAVAAILLSGVLRQMKRSLPATGEHVLTTHERREGLQLGPGFPKDRSTKGRRATYQP